MVAVCRIWLAVPIVQPAGATPSVEKVITVASPAGGRLQALLAMPPQPAGAIVMLPGGDGELGLTPEGRFRHGDNFVVRTRSQWLARGYAVLIPDAPDGAGPRTLRGRRSTPDYAAWVDALAARAHAAAAGPVFLLGTSQGAIAAANGAALAPPAALAGLILMEAVSRLGGSHETVFSTDLSAVRAPVLIVANRDDRCDVAPPADAARIASAMTHAASVQVLEVSGGIDQSHRACGSLSPHGYDGIEAPVIAAVTRWMGALRR